jgi:hypothetical protein
MLLVLAFSSAIVGEYTSAVNFVNKIAFPHSLCHTFIWAIGPRILLLSHWPVDPSGVHKHHYFSLSLSQNITKKPHLSHFTVNTTISVNGRVPTTPSFKSGGGGEAIANPNMYGIGTFPHVRLAPINMEWGRLHEEAPLCPGMGFSKLYISIRFWLPLMARYTSSMLPLGSSPAASRGRSKGCPVIPNHTNGQETSRPDWRPLAAAAACLNIYIYTYIYIYICLLRIVLKLLVPQKRQCPVPSDCNSIQSKIAPLSVNQLQYKRREGELLFLLRGHLQRGSTCQCIFPSASDMYSSARPPRFESLRGSCPAAHVASAAAAAWHQQPSDVTAHKGWK